MHDKRTMAILGEENNSQGLVSELTYQLEEWA